MRSPGYFDCKPMHNEPKKIAALYVRNDSIYKHICWIDSFDIDRDARSYRDGLPVIAHPPCRAWGRLKHFSKHPEEEKLLALIAIDQVRRNGGVLEHPSGSSLFKSYLPKPGTSDEYGFSISIDQFWWGHKARKRTYLYIAGIAKKELPEIPLRMDAIMYAVSGSKRLRDISKQEREATPVLFASWLCQVALLCKSQVNMKIRKESF